jgi:hypothetical protein
MALPNTGLAEVGSLIGDPARANLLRMARQGRRGLTATFGIALADDATPHPARRSVQ